MVTVAATDDGALSGDGPGQQFQAILVRVGVGAASRWRQGRGLSTPKLAKLSPGVSRETWRRSATEGHLPKASAVPAMAAALAALGADTTEEELTQALEADRKYRESKVQPFRVESVKSGASAADLFIEVLRGLPDEVQRDKFIAGITTRMSEDERVAFVTGLVTAPRIGREGSSDGATGASTGG